MTFFEHQDRARRQTWLLALYLLLAVVLIALAINAAIYWALVAAETIPPDAQAWLVEPWWMVITGATLLIVLWGSLSRYLSLRSGRAIADLMGGRLVDLATRDPLERRLINVVEEMAIASGTPVPLLYVMDSEPAINAFAAGYRPTEAAMVVSRGALESLDRDELQGVVGHEYSHILNGDMRLNVRLMAVLAGILMIGAAGSAILRSTFYRGARRSTFSIGTSSRRDSNSAPLIALGLLLVILGYVGLFFGRLIKAAVSRQREFLADASSVQFTRNPDGIAGALWKIREGEGGGILLSPRAEDTSHMCFEKSVTVHFFSNWLATHPPIEERVRAIDPHFKGKMAARKIKADLAGREGARTEPAPSPASATGLASFASGSGPGLEAVALPILAKAVVAQVGSPQPEHMAYAQTIHGAIPAAVRTAARVPDLAVALVYALLASDLAADKVAVGFALVKHRAGESTAEAVQRLQGVLKPLGPRFRLPVLDLAIPALKRLPDSVCDALLDTCDKLARVDRTVSVFEFSLLGLLRKHLRRDAGAADRVRFYRYKPVLRDLQGLLSLLAHEGAACPGAAQAAFDRAVAGFGEDLDLLPPDSSQPDAMLPALERLGELSPLLKQPVLEACTECIVHDGKVTIGESELLRAVAGSLDCPLPPLALGESA